VRLKLEKHARRRFRFHSFVDAGRGLRLLVATQPNASVHAVATVAALASAAFLRFSPAEWAALILAITGVWVAEGLNTAVEFLVDLVSPEYHQLAGWAKDVAAGAVLLASLGACLVGGLLFIPKLLLL
jgi:diacylglycerol kinase (ATP)